jgi:hypothetical protein
MLIFFARTQREHSWKSPKYRFTRRQREAWEALVKEAERSAREEEEQEEREETETAKDEDEIIADNIDEAIDETEAEENTTAEGTSEPEALLSIQKACLAFCIALLSQAITRKEYDSPLVCALAVLGVKEDS